MARKFYVMEMVQKITGALTDPDSFCKHGFTVKLGILSQKNLDLLDQPPLLSQIPPF